MDARPGDGAFAALFRLMAARAPGAELAVYAIADGRVRLVAATSAAGRAAERSDLWPQARAALSVAPRRGRCSRIDPAAFGLAARLLRAAAAAGAGGRADRVPAVAHPGARLGPRLAAALADAARIAAPLLAAARAVAAQSRRPSRRGLPRRQRRTAIAARLLATAAPAACRRPAHMAGVGRISGAPACAAARPRRLLRPKRPGARPGATTATAARRDARPRAQDDGRLELDLAEAAERGAAAAGRTRATSTSPTDGSAASRRCCAGGIRAAASSRRRPSFRWPRPPG